MTPIRRRRSACEPDRVVIDMDVGYDTGVLDNYCRNVEAHLMRSMEVTVDLGRSSLSNAETKLISYFVGDLISS